MKIIAITGNKRNGKDTLANEFIECFESKGISYQKLYFADPIKNFVEYVFKMDRNRLEFLKENEDLKFCNDLNMREILQRVSDKIKIDNGSDYFIEKLIDKIDFEKDVCVIPDLRFVNEANKLKELERDGKVEEVIFIRVRRNGIKNEDSHSSEKELDNINIEYIIENRTIDDLKEFVEYFCSIKEF